MSSNLCYNLIITALVFISIMITTEFQSTKTFLTAAFEQLEICNKIILQSSGRKFLNIIYKDIRLLINANILMTSVNTVWKDSTPAFYL